MALSDIADGLEVTTRQRERGVATVHDADAPLARRLERYADDLPCEPAEATAVVEAFVAGQSVGESARDAGLAPVTAAKALHLLGIDGVSPLSPTGREVLRDWLDADLSRSDALALADASDREFALAAFVETHDPLDGAREVVESALSPRGDAMVEKRDALGETMSGVADLR
jgi:hypothetical protein